MSAPQVDDRRYEIQYYDSAWGGWRAISAGGAEIPARYADLAEARKVIEENWPNSTHGVWRYRVYDREEGRAV